MCYYTAAAATTQSVCYSGDHKPFVRGSSAAAGWLLNEVQQGQTERQDMHSIPLKKPEQIILPGAEN